MAVLRCTIPPAEMAKLVGCYSNGARQAPRFRGLVQVPSSTVSRVLRLHGPESIAKLKLSVFRAAHGMKIPHTRFNLLGLCTADWTFHWKASCHSDTRGLAAEPCIQRRSDSSQGVPALGCQEYAAESDDQADYGHYPCNSSPP